MESLNLCVCMYHFLQSMYCQYTKLLYAQNICSTFAIISNVCLYVKCKKIPANFVLMTGKESFYINALYAYLKSSFFILITCSFFFLFIKINLMYSTSIFLLSTIKCVSKSVISFFFKTG